MRLIYSYNTYIYIDSLQLNKSSNEKEINTYNFYKNATNIFIELNSF